MTSKLALQWLPCQAPGIIGSALGLAGLVSVYCNWVRCKVCSATSISVWQHIKLSEQIRPWDTLACCWDVKRPTNNNNNNNNPLTQTAHTLLAPHSSSSTAPHWSCAGRPMSASSSETQQTADFTLHADESILQSVLMVIWRKVQKVFEKKSNKKTNSKSRVSYQNGVSLLSGMSIG